MTYPRISLFGLDGAHLTTLEAAFDRGRRFTTRQAITNLLADGRVASVPLGAPVSESSRQWLPILFGNRGTVPADTVISVAVPSGMLIPEIGFFFHYPFPIPPLVALASDGSGLISVHWEDNQSGTATVRRLDPAQNEVWAVDLTYQHAPVHEALRDGAIREGVRIAEPIIERANAAGRTDIGNIRDAVEEGLWIPANMPPFEKVFIGCDQSIWLRFFSPSTGSPPERSANGWLVLNETGAIAFSVEFPVGFNIQAGTRAFVWATQLGEFDEPYIVRLSITQ